MSDFVEMPQVRMDMAAFRDQEYFPMNKREWKRVRGKVEALAQKRNDFAAVGWSAIGVVVTAAFALLSWMPAYAAMEKDSMLEFAWVKPTLLMSVFAGIVVAFIAFTASRKFGQSERATAAEIVAEMNEVFDPDRDQKQQLKLSANAERALRLAETHQGTWGPQ